MTIPIYALGGGPKYHLKILIERHKPNMLITYYIVKDEKKIEDLLIMAKDHASIFMLDSGAFSAWNSGAIVSLFDYIDFIKKYHRYFTHIVCLDVIDNPIYSEVNHLVMLEELKDYNLEIIPVFHAGETFSVLDYMIVRGYKYIGISPNNGWREEEKREWLTEVFSRYDFEQLGIKTHGFGYQSIGGLRVFPLSTADANSWKLSAGFGGIITPEGIVLYSDKSLGKYGHVDNMSGGTSEFVTNICNELGFKIDDLKDSYRNRCVFNVEAIELLISENKNKLSFMPSLFSDDIPFDEKDVLEIFDTVKGMGRDYDGQPLLVAPSFEIRNKKKQKQIIDLELLF